MVVCNETETSAYSVPEDSDIEWLFSFSNLYVLEHIGYFKVFLRDGETQNEDSFLWYIS